MREVDVNAKVLAQVDWLEPSSYSFKAGEPSADVFDLHAERKTYTRCAERVVDVEARRHVQRDLGLPQWRLHAESRPRPGDRKVERMQVRRGGQAVSPPAGGPTCPARLLAGGVAGVGRRLLDALVRRAG